MGRIMPRVAEVFCDQDSTPWVAIKRNGTIMNMRLESQDFAELAIAASMIPDEQEFGSSGFVRPCGDSVIKSVRSAIRLLGRNNQRQMFLRYGCQDGKMLVDLCDDSQTIIEVDEKGWRPTPLKSISPFFRTENEAPLPFPEKGRNFQQIKGFLPFKNELDEIITTYFLGATPFVQYDRPFLVVSGPRAVGKSITCAMIRDFVDPHKKPPIDMPTDKRSLIVSISQAAVPTFDNCNQILPESFQSVLSGTATGFAHTERKLFSNFGQATISFRRPIIISGLIVPFTKEDLLSRCMILKFEGNFKSGEIDASILQNQFEKRRANIFGGMLDIISEAVKILPKIHPIPSNLIRFRDWARVAIAIGIILGIPQRTFTGSIHRNEGEAAQICSRDHAGLCCGNQTHGIFQ